MKRLIGVLLLAFALDASAIEIRFYWPETHGGPGSVIVDLSAPGLPAGCQFETDGNGVTNVPGDTNGALQAHGNFIGSCAPTTPIAPPSQPGLQAPATIPPAS